MDPQFFIAAVCLGSFLLGMFVIYLVFAKARRLDQDIAENLYTLLRVSRTEIENLEMQLRAYSPARHRRSPAEEEYLNARRMDDAREAQIAGVARGDASDEGGPV